MWSICKKELHQFFSSLTGYITIALFLLVSSIVLFLLGNNLFEGGYATLDKFFELAPWILLFLAPAITMRTLSEEFKTGTFEVLQTRPLTRWQIVLGKYVSVLLVLAIAILPTLVYVVTIKTLSAQGGIDGGGITGSYIGLFLLAAVFAAVGLCCSSFTANAVVAFLISAFTCLVLYFGFNGMGQLPFFRGGADYYIQMLGIDFHYQSISRGVLDSRDLIYFISLIYLFLLITVKNLRKK
jgi:ABC-2 type transport system permease protein